MYDTPVMLSAEFKDIDGFSWYSVKYTTGSISKFRIVVPGSKRWCITMDERIASIWHAILRQPIVTILKGIMTVTIAHGVDIHLTIEKIRPALAPVVESSLESDDDSECNILALKRENDELRAELAELRLLVIR